VVMCSVGSVCVSVCLSVCLSRVFMLERLKASTYKLYHFWYTCIGLIVSTSRSWGQGQGHTRILYTHIRGWPAFDWKAMLY